MKTPGILLGIAGVLFPFFILSLRRYGLRPSKVAAWREHPPKPLQETELRALAAWQKRNRTLLAVFVTVGLFSGILTWAGRVSEEASGRLFLIFLSLGFLGLIHHFSAACPRCRMRIGVQNNLVLPGHCLRCGVGLKSAR